MSPLLIVHICAGMIGLLSGAAAMSFRKGSSWHGAAGSVFVVSMLTMSGIGVSMAVMKSQIGNVLGGGLTFYLVLTAWLTARRREGRTGFIDVLALLVVSALVAGYFVSGIQAANSPRGSMGGIPAVMYFVLGAVALLAAVGDVRMFVGRGVAGAQRLARHLWRMCFALFIASASLFLARPALFPPMMRKSGALMLLTFLPVLLLVFWLGRVRFSRRYRMAGGSAGSSGRDLATSHDVGFQLPHVVCPPGHVRAQRRTVSE